MPKRQLTDRSAWSVICAKRYQSWVAKPVMLMYSLPIMLWTTPHGNYQHNKLLTLDLACTKYVACPQPVVRYYSTGGKFTHTHTHTLTHTHAHYIIFDVNFVGFNFLCYRLDSEGLDLMNKLLRFQSDKRMTAAECNETQLLQMLRTENTRTITQ